MAEFEPRTARINEQLVQYWHELRGDNLLPFEHEISTEALRDVWDSCFLVAIRPTGFFYEYLGRNLHEAYADKVMGREISETLVYPHPESLLARFRETIATAQPTMDENHFTNSRKERIHYRSCVLPFAGRGRNGVAFLLGGMRWKRAT